MTVAHRRHARAAGSFFAGFDVWPIFRRIIASRIAGIVRQLRFEIPNRLQNRALARVLRSIEYSPCRGVGEGPLAIKLANMEPSETAFQYAPRR
jgi:hypothetical protein